MSGESSVSSLKRFREASKDKSESENSVDFHSITGSVALNSTGSIASSAVGASSSLGVLRSNKLHDVGDGTDSHKIEISRSFLTPGNFLPPQADNSPVEAPSQRDRVATCLEAKVFQITMAILTVFALWGDDFLLWKMYKDFDDVFHALYAVTLVTFAAELTINSVVTEEYKWSFFFWLDVVATLSIALDIPWLMNLIMNMYGNVGQSFSVDGARAGRASRAGTKAGRIVRIVRLVRLIRVVNLSGWCVRTNKSDLDVHAEEAKVVSHQQEKQVKASRLGKMLSEQTTRTVILGVLCTLIVLPFIGEDNKVQNLTFGYALENIFWFGLSACTTVSEFIRASEQKLPINCTATAENAWMTSEGYSFMLYELAQSSRYDEDAVRTDFLYRPLLSLKVPDISTPAVGVNGTKVFGSTRWVPRIQTSRCTSAEKRAEIIYPFNIPEGFMPQVTCPANTCCWERHDACWDRTDECPWREKEMARVIFTPPGCEEESWDHSCNSFSIMAIYLDRYKTETEAGYSLLQTLFIVFLLVGGAMMFSKDTQILVINPIEKMVNIVKQLADDPLSKPDVTGEWSDDGNDKKKKGQASGGGQLETSMLENTILKIGSLLQVGFGEAGAQIIGKNMSSQDGELNILSPGRKIVGIFGFCDIREFMETTECLLEEVMVFVNKIARIVHICVHQWSGAANKNIGDSFLVTWIVNDPDEQHLMLTMGYEHCQKNCELADKALIAFLKIIAELRRASDLSAYARHPKIIPKFGMDYHVNMGFGIHVGWAIEGAIGSEHKIDASYLSPHVNMCARLETATRQYGINLLFSQALHQIIAQRGRDKCRKLDVVMLKGSLQPMGIFTFDVNDEVPSTPEGHDVGQVIPPAEITSESVRAKGVDWIYVLDQDILRLQEGITLDFHNSWRQAFHFYINGKWTAAKELLEKCNAFLPYGDGPSECLLNYINEHDCIPPDDWAGCRALSSK